MFNRIHLWVLWRSTCANCTEWLAAKLFTKTKKVHTILLIAVILNETTQKTRDYRTYAALNSINMSLENRRKPRWYVRPVERIFWFISFMRWNQVKMIYWNVAACCYRQKTIHNSTWMEITNECLWVVSMAEISTSHGFVYTKSIYFQINRHLGHIHCWNCTEIFL